MRRLTTGPGRRIEGFLRAVLRLYPAPFRRRFADSLFDTFDECYRERTGTASRLTFCLRTFSDLILQGLRERARPSFVARRPLAARKESTMVAWASQLLHELRFALRALCRRSGAGLLATLTIALGIGASSTIFSVVNGVLLRPLPYPEPAGLISIASSWSGPEAGLGSMSYPDLVDLRSSAPTIESLVGVNSVSMTLTGQGKPRVLMVTRLTEGLMQTFRVAPHLGRDLRADEFGPSGPSVVVVSYGFWQSQLGGNPGVLGRVLTLNGVSYEVVGVASPGFEVPQECELWIPRRLDPEDCGRACHTMMALGRLAPGATLDQAQDEVARIAADLTSAYPVSNTNKAFLVRSLLDQVVGEVRPGLLMMLGAVALVVLIACANVANLLLTQAASRSREIAIRAAIGAGRRHLLTQVLVESSLLAISGGALGLALAALGVRLLPTVVAGIPRIHAVTIDGNVLLFTVVTVIGVTLLFGTAPAFAFLRSSVSNGLARAGDSGAPVARERFRAMLLTVEVALSALLLIGAGLLLRSFSALYAVDLGFETRGLVRFNTLLPAADYQDLASVRAFYRELEQRARALPGVEAVASGWSPPLGPSRATGDVRIEGRPKPPPGQAREVSVKPVGPGWFETMGIERLAGRTFEPGDDVGPERVVLINETFARQHFAGQDPIGQRLELNVELGYGTAAGRIVGVVRDVRGRRLETQPGAHVYVPHGLFGPNSLTVAVRLRPDAPSPLPALRQIVAQLDPNVPMYRIETVEQAVREQIAPTRFYLILSLVFAGLAAILAAVGLYGVVAYGVSRRRREIGLRAALGASRPGLLRMVLARGMKPAIFGLALGLIASWFGSRVLAATLFGVEARDPWTFGSTAALLIAVSLLATLAPAWRASRIEPATALRMD